ncbi:hypothetical protein B0H16DRAFT_541666 [Mycena metata]|uniref:Uncharacterized protein n=1 Tax=Mycena metata TaxID=1033252 RepID=A0AAD7MEH1_9AGAR|nr:hypothetical protein B0H16DRAFT_541666 [Mycena metata]
MYSARVNGCESSMSVALYNKKTMDHWQDAISKHSRIRLASTPSLKVSLMQPCYRHPGVLQLFGIVESTLLRAAVYHDNMVPARQLMVGKPPIWRIYYETFLHIEEEIHPTFQIRYNCTLWIRPTTLSLCLEFTPDLNSIIHGDSFGHTGQRRLRRKRWYRESFIDTVPDMITSTSLVPFLNACEAHRLFHEDYLPELKPSGFRLGSIFTERSPSSRQLPELYINHKRQVAKGGRCKNDRRHLPLSLRRMVMVYLLSE